MRTLAAFAPPGALNLPPHGTAQAQHLGRRLREVDVHRIDLLDERQRRRLGLADQRAFGHQRAADAPEIGAVTDA